MKMIKRKKDTYGEDYHYILKRKDNRIGKTNSTIVLQNHKLLTKTYNKIKNIYNI